MKRLDIFLLLLCLVVGSFFRLYRLGELPSGIYVDEAALGYNAYSVYLTGKDEFGFKTPLLFRSFVDFKTPVYSYLLVLLLPFVELSEFTLRLPSALFGILTLVWVYLLVKKLTSEDKFLNKYLAFVVTFLLSISPWHVLFSRSAFETNISLSFLMLGILLFFMSMRKTWMLSLSAVSFGVSVVAYHSGRLIVPLLALALAYKFRGFFFATKNKKAILTAGVVGFVVVLPAVFVLFTPGFLVRASGLNIFSYSRQMPLGFDIGLGASSLLNNTFYLSVREFFALYFAYFSPRMMFSLGDYDLRTSYTYLPTFYFWQLPFYLAGLVVMIKTKLAPMLKFLTLTLLLITPIPAAITRDPYSTIRSLPLVIPQIILIGFSICLIFRHIHKNRLRVYTFVVIFVFLIFFSLLKLYSNVFVVDAHYKSKYWSYGWGEVVRTLEGLPEDIEVVVDNSRAESYIEILFYSKFDPRLYQRDNVEVSADKYYSDLNRVKEKKIGNIITRPINWEVDTKRDIYIVGDELSISIQQIKEHKFFLVNEILFPDGSVAFRIVRTNPKRQ